MWDHSDRLIVLYNINKEVNISIHKIPDQYLTTNLYIFRESVALDAVGDSDVTKSLAYAEIKANVQPQKSDVDYEVQGRIHRQTHAAYLNRVEDSVIREIKPGDIVLDEETGLSHLALGIQVLQAGNKTITDSHHIKLILETTTGYFEGLTKFKTTTVKAKIT